MKLFVAFIGSYDDRALLVVFDDQEKAEAACKRAVALHCEKWGGPNPTDVETVELNAMVREC